nr:hypothetical protein TetV2_00057 [Oceanusvirus sp.]
MLEENGDGFRIVLAGPLDREELDALVQGLESDSVAVVYG